MFYVILPGFAEHAVHFISVLAPPASMPAIRTKHCVDNVYSRRNATGKPHQIFASSQNHSCYICTHTPHSHMPAHLTIRMCTQNKDKKARKQKQERTEEGVTGEAEVAKERKKKKEKAEKKEKSDKKEKKNRKTRKHWSC